MPQTDRPSDADLAALRASIEPRLPQFLADLERLVNIDCGSYTRAGVDEVGRWVAAFMERLGARVEARPDPDGTLGDTIVGTFEGPPGRPRILLIGHMDTVFDPGTVAERPFRIDGNIATGPGVTDMKAGVLAGLYALQAIGAVPFERLTFIANPDEEIASPSSTPHIREAAADADVALVLECGRANGNIVSARKGIADVNVVVHGRAAHAGIEPEKGRHAILEAARIVREVQDLNGSWPGVTFNVGTIRGGTRPNVVPDRCEMEIETRSATGDGLDAAIAAVGELVARTGIPDTTAEASVGYSWRPMEKTERSARLAEHAKEVGRRLGMEFDDQLTGGASDANTTSGMGVPTLDGLGPVGGNDHAPSEYLEIDSIVPRTAMLAALLHEIAADPVVLEWRSGAAARAAPAAGG
jgi:glutamate carboxypeptidase